MKIHVNKCRPCSGGVQLPSGETCPGITYRMCLMATNTWGLSVWLKRCSRAVKKLQHPVEFCILGFFLFVCLFYFFVWALKKEKRKEKFKSHGQIRGALSLCSALLKHKRRFAPRARWQDLLQSARCRVMSCHVPSTADCCPLSSSRTPRCRRHWSRSPH